MKKRSLLILMTCVAIIFLVIISFQKLDLEHSSLLGIYQPDSLDGATIQTGHMVQETFTFYVASATVFSTAGMVLTGAAITAALLLARSGITPEEAILRNSGLAGKMVLSDLD